MKKKVILLLAATLCWFSSIAQVFQPDVISSSGSLAEGKNIMAHWHLGELAVLTLKGKNHDITQGFGQDNLIISRIDFLQKPALNARVYPNPVKDAVHIILEDSKNGFIAQLFDMKGLLIKEKTSEGFPLKLDMTFLEPGIYFLRIRKSWHQTATFKIVKK